MKELIVGGGCFWCTEAVFERLKGVSDVESGYANGDTPNPDYRSVCRGNTGYAEVIKITYNNEVIDLDTLFDIFFATHNPTQLNQQGADVGTQYRSCICYQSNEELEAAKYAMERAQKDYTNPIVTTLEPLKNYYRAEDYHQDYYRQNPMQGYCNAVIPPKIEKLMERFEDKVAK
ncbi:MAG: peptide-methionine (S)-S-oxide reductase MsrA [Sulfurovum sp.]|nr:peptide-methionine (S)-S-oxide reductase MsrA [Sulfurovum sp.]MCB4745478.1 peptide-methionine (S)-S-oxide reductase MsrA [Sulfurovum sp.]MCB4745626.1 peptide-methionine (S)-S-oxide reductase MsrA [Sulfurovum sp.]MCB4748473.1 peptide-methionine (S)-S-oxide reductase MsrA [Sulfurovum sp.]MCB4750544.1 peptide-methionine (S)-S-oxide reductase MsrA [Sulfurovum sp.]